jgi:hypothetical protein
VNQILIPLEHSGGISGMGGITIIFLLIISFSSSSVYLAFRSVGKRSSALTYYLSSEKFALKPVSERQILLHEVGIERWLSSRICPEETHVLYTVRKRMRAVER